MFIIIGAVIVLAAVIGGYLMEEGNIHVLFQPIELQIIGGAAIGAFIIASPMKIIKAVIANLIGILKGKSYSKQDYIETLMLLGEIFNKIRKEGLISIEGDIEEPEKSKIFSSHPKILNNHHVTTLITDTLRMVMTTGMSSHELEALLDAELEAMHEELIVPAQAVSNVADGMPALGIVAAVLGVINTMGKISEPPEVLGHSIGAALVGTFLGVLLSYGFIGPMAKSMEYIANEERDYLNVVKMALVSSAGGASPQIALEFGRRVIPGHVKPSFIEVEQAFKALRKK